MSCLDVMYHQSYGAHYLPAAAYKATYYNHHHQQQQRRLSASSKMQACMEEQQGEGGGGGRGMLSIRDQGLRQGPEAPGAQSDPVSSSHVELKDGTQPAETEYLSSRCVLFTYFQGDIGAVVDEHFSRALNQASTFSAEAKPIRVTQTAPSTTASLWKDGGSLSEGQSSSTWTTSYPPQTSSCLPASVSVSVHPHHPHPHASDFSPSPVHFSPTDGSLWADHHSLAQAAGLHQPQDGPWTYSLSPQNLSGYHNVYHPNPHVHTRSHHSHPRHLHHRNHPALHSYSESRFSPLLLAGVRSQNQNQPTSSTGSSPQSEGIKMEMEQPRSSSQSPVAWTPTVPHQGPSEVYDSALDQAKAKTSVWF